VATQVVVWTYLNISSTEEVEARRKATKRPSPRLWNSRSSWKMSTMERLKNYRLVERGIVKHVMEREDLISLPAHLVREEES